MFLAAGQGVIKDWVSPAPNAHYLEGAGDRMAAIKDWTSLDTYVEWAVAVTETGPCIPASLPNYLHTYHGGSKCLRLGLGGYIPTMGGQVPNVRVTELKYFSSSTLAGLSNYQATGVKPARLASNQQAAEAEAEAEA